MKFAGYKDKITFTGMGKVWEFPRAVNTNHDFQMSVMIFIL